MKTITFGISNKMHRDFKSYCATKGKSMKTVLTFFIERISIDKEFKKIYGGIKK